MPKGTYIKGNANGGYDPAVAIVPGVEQGVLVWPRTRPAQAAKGVILLVHGAGGAANQGASGGYFEGIETYLAENHGYFVVSVDAGSNGNAGVGTNPDTMGNSIAMGALDAAYKWATGGVSTGTSTGTAASTMTDTSQNWRANQWQGHALTCGASTAVVASNTATVLTLSAAGWTGGTPPSTSAYTIAQHYTDLSPFGKTKVVLLGTSMGGLVVRNWASRNASKVACIVDIVGVIDGTFQYGNGSQNIMDLAFGPAAPTAAPGTPTGTAGATSYAYKTCEVCSLGDGPATAASATNAALVAQASLNVSPNSVPTITHPTAYNSQGVVVTGTKILRSVAGGAFNRIDTVGQTKLTVATGTGATTSLTVAALPFAIPTGCVMTLSHPATAEGGTDAGNVTTQTVTLSAPAAANATTISVNSFTPASGGGSAAWAIGTYIKLATYVDAITGSGTAYTPVAAVGSNVSTAAWGVNAVPANPSFDPQAATNLTASLKAIPCQYWWSCNDGGTSQATGVPGQVPTQVSTFAAAYGANLTLQEIPGDPVHASAANTLSGSPSALATLASFVNANAP